jgi:hypothetical protein
MTYNQLTLQEIGDSITHVRSQLKRTKDLAINKANIAQGTRVYKALANAREYPNEAKFKALEKELDAYRQELKDIIFEDICKALAFQIGNLKECQEQVDHLLENI